MAFVLLGGGVGPIGLSLPEGREPPGGRRSIFPGGRVPPASQTSHHWGPHQPRTHAYPALGYKGQGALHSSAALLHF